MNNSVSFTKVQIDFLKSISYAELAELCSDLSINDRIENRLKIINTDERCSDADYKYELMDKLRHDFGGEYIEIWQPHFSVITYTINEKEPISIYDWQVDQRNYVVQQYFKFKEENKSFFDLFEKDIAFELMQNQRVYKKFDGSNITYHILPSNIIRFNEETAHLYNIYIKLVAKKLLIDE